MVQGVLALLVVLVGLAKELKFSIVADEVVTADTANKFFILC